MDLQLTTEPWILVPMLELFCLLVYSQHNCWGTTLHWQQLGNWESSYIQQAKYPLVN